MLFQLFDTQVPAARPFVEVNLLFNFKGTHECLDGNWWFGKEQHLTKKKKERATKSVSSGVVGMPIAQGASVLWKRGTQIFTYWWGLFVCEVRDKFLTTICTPISLFNGVPQWTRACTMNCYICWILFIKDKKRIQLINLSFFL